MSNGRYYPRLFRHEEKLVLRFSKKIGAKSILPNLYAKYVLEMLSSFKINSGWV